MKQSLAAAMKFDKRKRNNLTMMNPALNRKRNLIKKCKKLPSDFLCAKELGKKFLVCCPDRPGEWRKEVTIENSLQGKYVGLLFSHVDSISDLHNEALSPLKVVYDQLARSKPDAFEIVFVPICKPKSYEKNRDLFDTLLMQMPWLSIPFDEVVWRNHLYKKHDVFDRSHLFLFDNSPRRKQLFKSEEELLHLLTVEYGAELYPFTRARELELKTQYSAPFRSPNPSFEALLGSHLIYFDEHGVKNEESTISLLQGKEVVGLYLYLGQINTWRRRHPPHLEFTDKLEEYRARAGGNFEIVFVNHDFYSGYQSESSFHDFLIKHPRLLALPFQDSKIRALSSTLVAECCDSLATVQVVTLDGGDKKFSVDPYGASVIHDYGFDAYSFTRGMAVKVQMERLPTQFNLADIFKAAETEHLIHHINNENEKMKKPVSFALKNRVILYISDDWNDQHVVDCRKLRDIQDKNESLQVLFSSSPPPIVPTNMPNEWLAFPSSQWSAFIGFVINYNIMDGYGFFIAFDKEGKPMNIGQLGLVEDHEAFPFFTDKNEEVFRDLLLDTKGWDLEAECEDYLYT